MSLDNPLEYDSEGEIYQGLDNDLIEEFLVGKDAHWICPNCECCFLDIYETRARTHGLLGRFRRCPNCAHET